MSFFSTAQKIPLDLHSDASILQNLNAAAIVQRRKILELGHAHSIRLHYGAIMSCTEILTILYFRWMNIQPQNPGWDGRDRFVLSKGHAAPALYAALWLRGFFPGDWFDNFRRLHNPLQGHPDRSKTPGVDCSTGSLGQGFPVACGMALAAKIDHASYRVYALISDGECNEGSTWEAAMIAANLGLDRITVLLDWNQKSSYGPMHGRNDVVPLADKWLAFGWKVLECDGHDFVSLSAALAAAEHPNGQPSVILCRTLKGKGIPYAETHPVRSNFGLTEEQYQQAIDYLSSIEIKANP